MAYRFFVVPVRERSAACRAERFFGQPSSPGGRPARVDQGADSFWSFCVDYLESRSGADPGGRTFSGRGKIDYREVLSPEDFAVFARLRQLRKEIAQADAVPVYTIFTNDQLAQMVQSRNDEGGSRPIYATPLNGPYQVGTIEGSDGRKNELFRPSDRSS